MTVETTIKFYNDFSGCEREKHHFYWSRSVLVLTIPATATTAAAAAAILPNEGTWMLPNEGTGMLTQHLKRHFLGTRNLIVET